MDYKSSGIDIELGDDASKILYNATRKAYKTWNMGQGMVIATEEPEKVIEIVSESGILSKIIRNLEF